MKFRKMNFSGQCFLSKHFRQAAVKPSPRWHTVNQIDEVG